jgi:hypothetical protein
MVILPEMSVTYYRAGLGGRVQQSRITPLGVDENRRYDPVHGELVVCHRDQVPTVDRIAVILPERRE